MEISKQQTATNRNIYSKMKLENQRNQVTLTNSKFSLGIDGKFKTTINLN